MLPDEMTGATAPYGEPWLTHFLHRQADPAGPHGKWIRLQLLHLPTKWGIRTWAIDEDVSDERLAALQEDILSTAQEQASRLFGNQRFILAAYHDKRPSEPSESTGFIRDGGGAGVSEDGEVDPQGLGARDIVAQTLRHTEGIMRTFQAGVVDLMRVQSKVVAEQADMIREYHARHFANVHIQETLLSQAEERRTAAEAAKLKQQVWLGAARSMSVLAPVVVNKLAGATILPPAGSVLKEIESSVLASLTKDQLDKLLGVLDPDQVVGITQLINERNKAKERYGTDAEAERKALLDGTGSLNGAGTAVI